MLYSLKKSWSTVTATLKSLKLSETWLLSLQFLSYWWRPRWCNCGNPEQAHRRHRALMSPFFPSQWQSRAWKKPIFYQPRLRAKCWSQRQSHIYFFSLQQIRKKKWPFNLSWHSNGTWKSNGWESFCLMQYFPTEITTNFISFLKSQWWMWLMGKKYHSWVIHFRVKLWYQTHPIISENHLA